MYRRPFLRGTAAAIGVSTAGCLEPLLADGEGTGSYREISRWLPGGDDGSGGGRVLTLHQRSPARWIEFQLEEVRRCDADAGVGPDPVPWGRLDPRDVDRRITVRSPPPGLPVYEVLEWPFDRDSLRSTLAAGADDPPRRHRGFDCYTDPAPADSPRFDGAVVAVGEDIVLRVGGASLASTEARFEHARRILDVAIGPGAPAVETITALGAVASRLSAGFESFLRYSGTPESTGEDDGGGPDVRGMAYTPAGDHLAVHEVRYLSRPSATSEAELRRQAEAAHEPSTDVAPSARRDGQVGILEYGIGWDRFLPTVCDDEP